jgi:choline-sulfatase
VIVDLPEDDYNERRRALVHGKWKLIAFGDDVRFSLFDLEADPKEEKDLFWKDKEMGQEMRDRYKRIGKSIREVLPAGGIPGKRDR